MKYGITATTGHFGQAAFRALADLVPATSIVALARNVEHAQTLLPAGTEIRPADYTNLDQLVASFQGIDKLLFVSSQPGPGMPRAEQHHNVVKAAQQAEVQFVAYTSFPAADRAQSFLAADHKQTEQWIQAAGFQHAFLRNNWYLENELATMKAALNSSDFPYAAEDGKVGWTREVNYARGAAKVLTLADPKPVYEFGGKPISYPELIAELTAASGQEITPVPMSDADYKQALLAGGMDDATAGFVIGVQDLIKHGELDVPSDDLNAVLDGQLEALSEGVAKLLNLKLS